ncbi:MAG: hypothetical protein LBG58_01070 [Planctomycetaceae bacterium]|jgi:hypothetical protein|nr:hypothetical protein [Planctomycetaceae bacterium]
MRRFLLPFSLMFIVVAICCSTVIAQTADDFILASDGGSTQVAKPNEVQFDPKNNAVHAATIQDGINAAAELTEKNAQTATANTDELVEDEPMFKLVFSKEGNCGAVATGIGTYADSKNPDQVNLAKRRAFVQAYLEAKKNLAQGFQSVTIEAKTEWKSASEKIVSDDGTQTNKQTSLDEYIKESFQRVIKCYVVKEVREIPDEKSVYVTVITTARTMGKFARPVPALIDVNDLKAGLNHVLKEIMSGILLPVGGRAISTPGGELCYVGYGSALIGYSKDDEVRRENLLDARKIAEMRARTALLGIIKGDQIIWNSTMQSGSDKRLSIFDHVNEDDPTTKLNETEKSDLEKRKKEMTDKIIRSDSTQSIIKGTLPPGIQIKTYRDKDNVWYYAVAVYSPSLTQKAADLGAQMDSANPVQEIRSAGRSSGATGDGSKVLPIQSGQFKDDDEYK